MGFYQYNNWETANERRESLGTLIYHSLWRTIRVNHGTGKVWIRDFLLITRQIDLGEPLLSNSLIVGDKMAFGVVSSSRIHFISRSKLVWSKVGEWISPAPIKKCHDSYIKLVDDRAYCVTNTGPISV